MGPLSAQSVKWSATFRKKRWPRKYLSTFFVRVSLKIFKLVIGHCRNTGSHGSPVIGHSGNTGSHGSPVIGRSGNTGSHGSPVIGRSGKAGSHGSPVIGRSGKAGSHGSPVIGRSGKAGSHGSPVIGCSGKAGSQGSRVLPCDGTFRDANSRGPGCSRLLRAFCYRCMGSSGSTGRGRGRTGLPARFIPLLAALAVPLRRGTAPHRTCRGRRGFLTSSPIMIQQKHHRPRAALCCLATPWTFPALSPFEGGQGDDCSSLRRGVQK